MLAFVQRVVCKMVSGEPEPQDVTGMEYQREEGDEDLSPAGDGRLLKRVLKEGAGSDLPWGGCNVTVHYTGTLLDGSKFDSSKDRDQPFQFMLGKGKLTYKYYLHLGVLCVPIIETRRSTVDRDVFKI